MPKKEKEKMVRLDMKISVVLYNRLTVLAEKADTPKSAFAREIIEDYLKLTKTRTFSELKSRLETLIPDFQSHELSFKKMVTAVQSYSKTNNDIHKYIAEQKSAESFYFREIKDRIDEMNKRNDYLEEAINTLVDVLGKNNKSSADSKNQKEKDEETDKLFKSLFGSSDT